RRNLATVRFQPRLDDRENLKARQSPPCWYSRFRLTVRYLNPNSSRPAPPTSGSSAARLDWYRGGFGTDLATFTSILWRLARSKSSAGGLIRTTAYRQRNQRKARINETTPHAAIVPIRVSWSESGAPSSITLRKASIRGVRGIALMN